MTSTTSCDHGREIMLGKNDDVAPSGPSKPPGCTKRTAATLEAARNGVPPGVVEAERAATIVDDETAQGKAAEPENAVAEEEALYRRLSLCDKPVGRPLGVDELQELEAKLGGLNVEHAEAFLRGLSEEEQRRNDAERLSETGMLILNTQVGAVGEQAEGKVRL
eukprot:g8365.t1